MVNPIHIRSRTAHPVFATSLSERNEKEHTHNDDTFAERPRVNASGLGKCYQEQLFRMQDKPKQPITPITRHVFEVGNMYERHMDWRIEQLRKDKDVHEILEQVPFEFPIVDDLKLTGRADAVIYWDKYPETQKPAIDVVDFKTKGNFGYVRLREEKENTPLPNTLQVGAGLKFFSSEQIDLKWRLVYINKDLPPRYKMEDNDPLSWAIMEHTGSFSEIEADLEEDLSNIAMVYKTGKAKRVIPGVTQNQEIIEIKPKKGIWEDKNGNRNETWHCGYCQYSNLCIEELEQNND